MSKYQKRKSYWAKKCDKSFSDIIKLRAGGKCEETKANLYLQCAHIIPRSYHATRWDLDNAICLSRNRHKFYTHHPVEWQKFIDEKFGKGYYKELSERALNYKKRTLEDLKELYESLENVRNSHDERTGKFKDKANPGRV